VKLARNLRISIGFGYKFFQVIDIAKAAGLFSNLILFRLDLLVHWLSELMQLSNLYILLRPIKSSNLSSRIKTSELFERVSIFSVSALINIRLFYLD